MIGTTIAQYRIVSNLGEGGMGHVYLAHDTRLGRQVAIKVLTPAPGNADAAQRFLQEARLASSLSHPNIAHIYEIGESGAASYLVMEYVEGVPLSSRLIDG